MSTPNPEYAKAMYEGYDPMNRERFERMLRHFRGVEKIDHWKTAQLLFLLDMSYDRTDLVYAIGIVEREKGWKAG